MVNIKKLEEFANFDSLNKFIRSYKCQFSDGKFMTSWFYQYKQEIFELTDQNSIKIKKDYEKHMQIMDEQKKNSDNFFYKLVSENALYAKEFLKCEDLSKFEFGSNCKFADGKRMDQWFIENKNYIFSNHSEVCKKIRIQYDEKVKIDNKKKTLLEIKYRLLFYKEPNLMKFDEYSNFKFFDGSSMHKWFNDNKENIARAREGIFFEIQKQYDMYLAFIDLKKEFFKQDNMDKFNEEGWVKFSTGAIMYFWWESYMEKILNSNNPLDCEIRFQYERYCDNNDYSEQKDNVNSIQINFNN